MIATVPGMIAPLVVELFCSELGTSDGFRAAFGLMGLGVSVPAVALFVCRYTGQPVGEPVGELVGELDAGLIAPQLRPVPAS